MAKGRRCFFFDAHEREVCKMQSAETILGIVHERGKRGLPLTNIYWSCSEFGGGSNVEVEPVKIHQKR